MFLGQFVPACLCGDGGDQSPLLWGGGAVCACSICPSGCGPVLGVDQSPPLVLRVVCACFWVNLCLRVFVW